MQNHAINFQHDILSVMVTVLIGEGNTHTHTHVYIPVFFLGGGYNITADGQCNHEIKRLLLLGRKAMT